ncbi:MAG: energy-dependent translational throttle protein EttA [Silvanigrellales bacterium]|nr:energy-dependent translational throttle protein EttA [Silvanigrellales bacterium]
MANYIYNMVNLRKSINGKEILKGIYLSFLPGAKIGVIGNNGAGKSTLLRIMAGVDQNFNGDAFPAKGIKVGFLPQEPELDETKTVQENVEEAFTEPKRLLARFEELNMKMCEPLGDAEMQKVIDESARVQDQLDASGAWDLDRTIEIAMDALRCPPGDASVKTLSGGERRRVALCRLLLSKPDLLLLDEPTNHLDAESVQWLERHLREFPGTMVCVTHDRYFLDNVTEWILELDRGQGVPWHTNYSRWLEGKTDKMSQEEKQESVHQKTLKRELEWIRASPKARQSKAKWRITQYQDLVNQSNEKSESLKEITFPPCPRLGDVVVEASGLTKSFGDRLLFENLEFRLPPGGIVGVIGPNGAGKSTLFKMIAGLETPDSGTLKIGDTVKASYVDQNRETLDGSKSVFDELTGGRELIQLGNKEVNGRAYISSFGFSGASQQKLVGALSGGERNRLNLAKLVMNGGNLLLLDEPTNDLDVDTLRALEDGLLSFPGCAVVISHDRWFLDRIATHILAFEGDSRVVWFEGNYQDYMEDKRRRLGDDAVNPKRIKYKPLLRG